MADEIIALERHPVGATSMRQDFAFLYAIPSGDLVEIGGTGTSGKYPVMTPAPTDADDPLYIVLTQQERADLDAGTHVLYRDNVTVLNSANDAAILAILEGLYGTFGPIELQKYKDRYEYIGRRFDKA